MYDAVTVSDFTFGEIYERFLVRFHGNMYLNIPEHFLTFMVFLPTNQ